MADEPSVALGDATRFAHLRRKHVALIEQITRRAEQVDLVRRYQSTQRQRIRTDERHDFAIGLGRRVEWQVDPPDSGGPEPQFGRPSRKHLQNRGLSSGDADEVEGGNPRRLENTHFDCAPFTMPTTLMTLALISSHRPSAIMACVAIQVPPTASTKSEPR